MEKKEKYVLVGEKPINFLTSNNLVGLCECMDEKYSLKVINYKDEIPINSKEITYTEYLMISGMCDVLDNIRNGDIDEVNEKWFYDNIQKVADLSSKEYNPFDIVEMLND